MIKKLMKREKTRGYVTMAAGSKRYYKLAATLLASYKFHNADPLPFAIICDKRNKYTVGFDDVVIMDSPRFSFLDKLRLAEWVPYDENIFIDADSLVFRDLGGLWEIVKDSPDFGIFGAIYDPESEKGRIELERAGSLKDKMHFPCSCQGGMYFIRKSSGLAPFTELSLFILDRYSEFMIPGFPSPSDDTIFPLSCSVYNYPPPEDWWKIFCYLPESDVRIMDVVKGDVRYLWRVTDSEMGPGCYFVHFSTKGTKEWLYNREKYRLESAINGKRPSSVKLAAIWLLCSIGKTWRSFMLEVKIQVYKLLKIVGLK